MISPWWSMAIAGDAVDCREVNSIDEVVPCHADRGRSLGRLSAPDLIRGNNRNNLVNKY